MMWKFLRGGATVIPGATFIPESRVVKKKYNIDLVECSNLLPFFYPPTSFLLSWPWKRRIIAFLRLAQRFVVWEGLVLSRQGHEMSKKVFANKKSVFPTKMSPTFNHNWHEGDTFISLSF